MFCPRCKNDNTKCIDDMLTMTYLAEIYKCNDCSGTIEVIYDKKISYKTIKDFRYYVAE